MASHLEGFGAGARRAEAKKPSKCDRGFYADSFSANSSTGLLLPSVRIGLLLLQIKCSVSFLFKSSTLLQNDILGPNRKNEAFKKLWGAA